MSLQINPEPPKQVIERMRKYLVQKVDSREDEG